MGRGGGGGYSTRQGPDMEGVGRGWGVGGGGGACSPGTSSFLSDYQRKVPVSAEERSEQDGMYRRSRSDE